VWFSVSFSGRISQVERWTRAAQSLPDGSESHAAAGSRLKYPVAGGGSDDALPLIEGVADWVGESFGAGDPVGDSFAAGDGVGEGDTVELGDTVGPGSADCLHL
jgi:hypothetical protein